ncbi:Na+ dependent nucleoside transporter [Bacteroidota bacterium]|nr:Na+ dependent nucleoside transporter [Bacteroidota bacterium]MDC3229834.1 Na+ dependent nucleoside transporter [Bacteroidota bacterium]
MRFCFFLVFALSFTKSSAEENIFGIWSFEAIFNEKSNKNENLKPIGPKDFLKINLDNSFEYKIDSLDLEAKGNFTIENDILVLNYTSPKDTTRIYKLSIQKDRMILNENDIIFEFKKIQKNWINDIFRGILGLASLVLLLFAFSRNKGSVKWGLVFKGIIIQILFAICILKVPVIMNIFEYVSKTFVVILNFTEQGSLFLFGSLISDTESFGYIFAFQVLPTIIFFSSLTSVLFYYGILQKVVLFFAKWMKKFFNLSGSESLAAVGNIFLGQTESPLLVKPYIKNMTTSELLCLMSGGMATIAGGVLAAYIGFLGGSDIDSQIFFAKHLIAASVMSAPAAIVASKILIPETKEINQGLEINNEDLGTNVLEAISIGTKQGISLAVNVGAMLLVFVAFISMINYFLSDFFGNLTGANELIENITNGNYSSLSMEFLFGYLFAPLSWLIGVCYEDILLVGQLLGEKTILNEFVAYITLADLKESNMFFEQKSLIIATYILCGFANFASIGIQIGGIGAIAPTRTKDLSKLGILALVAGTAACLFTATIVGIII